MELPIYYITVDSDGFKFLSFVKDPANDVNWVKLNKSIKLNLNEEQQIVTSAVLIPDQKILREGYYISFSADSIKEIARQLINKSKQVDINHKEQQVEGIVLQEVYLKNSLTGINPIWFKDLPDGTLIASYKVYNPEIWSKIKSGELNGFSVELIGYTEELLYNDIYKTIKKLKNLNDA